MPRPSSVGYTSVGGWSANSGWCSVSSKCRRSASLSRRGLGLRTRALGGDVGAGGLRLRYSVARLSPSASHATFVGIESACSSTSAIRSPLRVRAEQGPGARALFFGGR